jgi:hypothetical protein
MEMDGQDLEFQQLGISVDPDPHFRACPLGGGDDCPESV